jgi:hypothetical protein
MVCLDELVAEDDGYRRLDRLVDWSFVRELAASYLVKAGPAHSGRGREPALNQRRANISAGLSRR